MSEQKLCECGCGQPTTMAKRTLRKYGYVAGEPLRYLPGHQNHNVTWSDERRKAFREKMLGHPVSEETRRKMSEYNKANGVRPSDEAIAKSNLNRGTRENSPSWKGGISYTNGYRCIYAPDHPRRHPNGYVYEHVLVAESKIGRPLLDGEVVHHIDRDKLNNDPDNLQVLPSQSAHAKLHREQGDID